MDKFIAALITLVAAILAAVAIGALMALPVMWLWNYLFTTSSITGTQLPSLDFWHAWALLVLAGILVKSGATTSGK